MSQWLHVNVSIRLDTIRGMVSVEANDRLYRELEQTLGKSTIPYDCDEENEAECYDLHENCTLPKGGEGSVKYMILPTREIEDSSLCWGLLIIYGDLREPVTSTTEIVDWLNALCAYLEARNWSIRSGVGELETEGVEVTTWRYSHALIDEWTATK